MNFSSGADPMGKVTCVNSEKHDAADLDGGDLSTGTGSSDVSGAAEADADTPADAAGAAPGRRGRVHLLAAGALLAACTGLLLYGVLGDGGHGDRSGRSVPTASVTYEVTGSGTADLTYQAGSTSGKAVVARDTRLPWHRTVRVPFGQDPEIHIVLDGDGGRARCTLEIRGRHVQSATADGRFGRATCSGVLPSAEQSAAASSGRH